MPFGWKASFRTVPLFHGRLVTDFASDQPPFAKRLRFAKGVSKMRLGVASAAMPGISTTKAG